MNHVKILVMTIGGTILSVYDPHRKSIAPGVKGNELLQPIIGRLSGVTVDVRDEHQKPGPHLTPEFALQIAEQIERLGNDYDGFVVVQGTDTIEEFAYMISLIVPSDKPVVFTGAMKSNNEFYSDGLGNVASSLLVAGSPKSRGRGVMVVFNERIFSPRHIVKMHASNMDAFQAPDTGPLGSVVHGEVHYHHEPAQAKRRIFERRLEPNVELLKATMGSRPFLLDRCIEAGVKGLVIEGFGAGNVPPDWMPGIANAVRNGIPVIIASRCPGGSAGPFYDYAGGGKTLEQLGVVFAGDLSGAKARIRLMLLLGQSPRLTAEDIGEAFRSESWRS